ncbi:hypothetical protein PGB90_001012 [Kerria lacca]
MIKRKLPENSNNVNNDFCDFLMELAEYEKNVSRNIYKFNAYRKAASTLASHPVRIKSGQEAKKLNGIGDKIASKLDEFIETGQLEKVKKIREDNTNSIINTLTRVSGIGPAKAKELIADGIETIEDLRKHTEKLNHHQIIGLKYLEDFETKIPREEIEQIEVVMRSKISELDSQFEIIICGSYRRGKQESGDIDVLISHPSYTSHDTKSDNKLLENVVNVLKSCQLIVETISLGSVKFMGACRIAKRSRRLDIRLTPYDQYFCAVLYFTGSDLFNKEMRAHALNNGFTLNEYTLRKIGSTGVPGEPLLVTCEEDIFDYIDYPYKKPEERNI